MLPELTGDEQAEPARAARHERRHTLELDGAACASSLGRQGGSHQQAAGGDAGRDKRVCSFHVSHGSKARAHCRTMPAIVFLRRVA